MGTPLALPRGRSVTTRRIAGLTVRAALAGVATSAVVAWLLAILPPIAPRNGFRVMFDGSSVWQVNSQRSIGGSRVEWFQMAVVRTTDSAEQRDALLRDIATVLEEGPGPRSRRTLTAREPVQITEHSRGWPAMMLWCEVIPVLKGSQWASGAWEGAIPLSPPTFPPMSAPLTALPLRVIWPGLAIDTAFYSALWAAAVIGGRSVRTAVRFRRGQCVHCGYDLRGTKGVCPECGRGQP